MSSSSPPPPSPTTATMSSPSPPPPSPTTATMLSPSPPRNQPQMVVNRSSVFRQHPEMVVHFPSGPRKQPVINPPFEYRQHPQMVIPSFTKSDFLEINDATDDSDPSTFQMNSVDAVGIPPSWNEDKIKEAFQEFGHIEQVLLASKRNKITTIKYTTQEGALSCIASFSKKKLTNNGRKVNVHVSLAKPEQKDKRIEERSRSRKKSKLNQKEDELEFPVMWPKTSLESLMSLDSFNHKASAIPRPTDVATSTSASASVPSTTTAQASSSALVDSNSRFTTSTSLEIVREPIIPSEMIRETLQEEHTITHELETRILQNRDVLTKIEAEFEKIVATRTHLVKMMYLIEDHQEKIVEALEKMESVMEELLLNDHDATQRDTIPWITRRDMELIVRDMNLTISALYSGQGRSTTLMDVVRTILEEQMISLL